MSRSVSHGTVPGSVVALLVFAVLPAAGCFEKCSFTNRCEGNVYVSCASNDYGHEPEIHRRTCEGLNPVCLSDESWNSGCFAAATPGCTAGKRRECRGEVHVLCSSLNLGPGGAAHTYEQLTDCVQESKRFGETKTCMSEGTWICASASQRGDASVPDASP